MNSYFLLQFIFSLITLDLTSTSPLSNPLTSDGEIGRVIPDHFESRKTKPFHLFSPNKSHEIAETELDGSNSCGLEFSLSWSTSVGQAILTTPVIYPGTVHLENKNIFIAALNEKVELLEGDGSRLAGWPIKFSKSSFQASPLVFDIDGDGYTDVGVTDEDANLYWIRVSQFGKYLEDYHIQIPKLRIKRNWMEMVNSTDNMYVYVGLSRFDRNRFGSTSPSLNTTKAAQLDPLTTSLVEAKKDSSTLDRTAKQSVGRRLSEEVDGAALEIGEEVEHPSDSSPEESLASMDIDQHYFDFEEAFNENKAAEEGEEERDMTGGLDQEDVIDRMYGYGSSVNMVRNGDDLFHYYMERHYGYAAGEEDGSFVAVDPHVLSTPAMADINQDGHMEIVFPVSYYFDSRHRHKLETQDPDFNPDLYVASGLVCWDMEMQEWLWTVHLDLTTAASKYPAVIYSTPTIVDLDGDDRLEVVIGTSVGMLYVLDGQTGFTRRAFPMQFHSIHAQVAVADVLGGPHMELIVADMGGTIAVVNSEGDILWDQSLSGSLPFTPTVADIDLDGQLDIVVATVDEKRKSHIFALRGDTGQILEGFPLSLPRASTISGPILFANLDLRSEYDDPIQAVEFDEFQAMMQMDEMLLPPDRSKIRPKKQSVNSSSPESRSTLSAPHLIVSSLDGNVYIMRVDTRTQSAAPKQGPKGHVACLQRLAFGSPIIASPLLDDVTNDGFLDLIVTSFNGEVFAYETSVPFHPSNVWNSFPRHHGKAFSYGDISLTISVDDKRRWQRFELNPQLEMQNLTIHFEILDRRCMQKPCSRDEYRVRVTRGSDRQRVLWSETFSEPGSYAASFPPIGTENAVYTFAMETKFGKYAEDFIATSATVRFYVWLKYLVLAPMLLFSSLTLLKISRYL